MRFPLLLVALCHPSHAISDDLPILHAHLLSSYMISSNTSGADAQAALFLSALQPDGSFSDLNYTDTSEFTPWAHALRFSAMASVMATPACAHYGSAALRAGALSAYAWFLRVRPISGNWWMQSIGCALPVSQLALQLAALLSPAQRANASAVLALSTWEAWSRTGTNAVDIGKVRIARGVLEGNASMVAEAFGVIWGTFKPATSLPPESPEGPKLDGSFMQHGPQLYNGNYGVSWANSALELIALGANTSFAATNSSYEVAAVVYLNGIRRRVHRASLQWDMAVVGRQSAAPNAQAATGVPVSAVNPGLMRAAGGARAAEFRAVAEDVENPGAARAPPSFVVFYASDYAVFTRPGYTASVRMIGARVAGGECINGQGTRSLHAADGVTYLYQHGFEYRDIGPTWDWQRLPGITVQVNGTQLNCTTAGSQGTLPNVGGVTDGEQGVAWMDFEAAAHGQALLARKAYFFLDAALLALGAAISSAAPASRVTTTVESCLLAGGVWVGRAGGGPLQPLPPGSHALPPPDAAAPLLLWHDGVGDVLLPPPGAAPGKGSAVFVLNANVTGSWAALGGPPVPATTTNAMFTLTLDHGDPPVVGGAYAYARLPGVALAAFEAGWAAALAAAPAVAATPAYAAVYDAASGRRFAAVFDNSSAVPVPRGVEGLTSVALPLPGGFILATYRNATTGNFTLAINVTFPAEQNLHAGGAHPGPDLRILTDAALVPCADPHCPNAFFCRSKHDCDAGWSYDCFANGTIRILHAATQASWLDGIVPPLLCTMAEPR